MESEDIRVTAFMGVIQDKLTRQKAKIKKILDNPKSERNKERLKLLLKEAKRMKHLVKQHSKNGIEFECPECKKRVRIHLDETK